MGFVESLLAIFSNYPSLISFLGGLLGGEETLLALSFLAANNMIPLEILFIFGFLGVYVCDLIVFSIGRFKLVHNFEKLEKHSPVYQRIDKFISKLTNESPFLALMYTKFIYGARLLTLIYLGLKKISLKQFLVSNFIVDLIWMSVIIMLGWLAGSGFKFVLDVFKNVQAAIGLVIVFVIILLIGRKCINVALTVKQKQLK